MPPESECNPARAGGVSRAPGQAKACPTNPDPGGLPTFAAMTYAAWQSLHPFSFYMARQPPGGETDHGLRGRSRLDKERGLTGVEKAGRRLGSRRCGPEARSTSARLPHLFMKLRGPQAHCKRRQKPIICPAAAQRPHFAPRGILLRYEGFSECARTCTSPLSRVYL